VPLLLLLLKVLFNETALRNALLKVPSDDDEDDDDDDDDGASLFITRSVTLLDSSLGFKSASPSDTSADTASSPC
jgi:hypothetical protein